MAELHVDKLSVNRIKHAADSDFLTADMTASKFQPGNTVTGFTLYDQAGTFTFIVPAGVTKLSALCIGAGGGGYYNWAGNGGGGGGAAWADNIEVTAGQTITITVPGTTSPSTRPDPHPWSWGWWQPNHRPKGR